MRHAASWCHGQLQDDKSVLKTANLKLWPDGTKICKTGGFFCFVSGFFCQTDAIPQGHNSNHRQKKPQTVLTELCISEHCFIKCFHVFFNKCNLFPEKTSAGRSCIHEFTTIITCPVIYPRIFALSISPCAKCVAFYNLSDLKEENAVNIVVSYQLGF